eukprot:scaffold34983_cov69-Cyclotella_meneghiniana.AAC.4
MDGSVNPQSSSSAQSGLTLSQMSRKESGSAVPNWISSRLLPFVISIYFSRAVKMRGGIE